MIKELLDFVRNYNKGILLQHRISDALSVILGEKWVVCIQEQCIPEPRVELWPLCIGIEERVSFVFGEDGWHVETFGKHGYLSDKIEAALAEVLGPRREALDDE